MKLSIKKTLSVVIVLATLSTGAVARAADRKPNVVFILVDNTGWGNLSPALRAFYYVRVIEIPTPRWTACDAKYFGIKMPKEVPMITTERAYTSPIWYTP